MKRDANNGKREGSMDHVNFVRNLTGAQPAILATTVVGNVQVDEFRTRFGGTVFIIVDPRRPVTHFLRCLGQTEDRAEALAFAAGVL